MPEPTGQTGEPKEGEGKVTFTPEQKEAINSIIEDRLGRERKKHKDEVDALTTQLNDLKSKKPPKEGGDGGNGEGDADLKNQFQRLLNDQKTATKNAEDKANDLLKKLTDQEKVNMALRKDMAFREAADGVNLVKGGLKTLTKLVGDSVEWDADRNAWQARDENGQVVMNDQLKPASLQEFVSQYTNANDFLLNGDIKPGAGASESSKNGNFAQFKTKADFKTDEDKVAYIKKFGPGAFAKLPLK